MITQVATAIAALCFNVVAAASRENITSCSFDNDHFCDFINEPAFVDNFDWFINYNTLSYATGPSNGAKGADSFAYIEASGKSAGSYALLASPVLTPGTYVVDFYQFAKGDGMGALEVYAASEFDKTTHHMMWSRVIYGRADDTVWSLESANISLTENFRIYFKGVRGYSYNSDFAIDEVNIYRTANITNGTLSNIASTNAISCDFGAHPWCTLCGLSSYGSFAWHIRSTPPDTQYTGPPTGYHDCYGTADTSSTLPGEVARFSTQILHSNTGCMTVTMHYYGYGQQLGDLIIQVQERTSATVVELWRTSSTSRQEWLTARVDFNVTAQFKIYIDMVSTGGIYGDYAIDNLHIGECGNVSNLTSSSSAVALNSANQYECDFDNGDKCLFVDSTNDDFDWSLTQGSTISSGTGPSCDVRCGGNYAYIETSNPRYQSQYAVLETQMLKSSSNCLDVSFYFHGFGRDLGSLEVLYLTGGSSWNIATSLWSTSGQSYNSWRYVTASIPNVSQVKIGFKGTVGAGYQGDYAIDEIRIGECNTIAQPVVTTVSVPNTWYLTASSGVITSPGYPVSYAAGTTYTWYILVDQTLDIKLQLQDMDTESCCDRIKVYDRQYGSSILNEWSGQMDSSTASTYQLNTWSHYVMIEFQSDGSIQGTGFQMVYYTTDLYGTTLVPWTYPPVARTTTTIAWNDWDNNGGWGHLVAPIAGGVSAFVFVIIVMILCCCLCKKKPNTVSAQRTQQVSTVSGNKTFRNQQYQSATNNTRYYNPAYAPSTAWWQSRYQYNGQQQEQQQHHQAATNMPPNNFNQQGTNHGPAYNNQQPTNNGPPYDNQQTTHNVPPQNNQSGPSSDTNNQSGDHQNDNAGGSFAQPTAPPIDRNDPFYSMPQDHNEPLAAPPSYSTLYGTGSFDATSNQNSYNYVP